MDIESKKGKYTNLDQLNQRTKSNPILMMEMITLYIEQTHPLIVEMKKGLENKDWDKVRAAVHKMIPSFSIVGISVEYENIAKNIQENTRTLSELDKLPELISQLENVCEQACKELEEEFNIIKNTKK